MSIQNLVRPNTLLLSHSSYIKLTTNFINTYIYVLKFHTSSIKIESSP